MLVSMPAERGASSQRRNTDKLKTSGLPVRDKDEQMERNCKETKERLILKAKRQVLKTVETNKQNLVKIKSI